VTEHVRQCYSLKDEIKLMSFSVSHGKFVACNSNGSEVITCPFRLVLFRTWCRCTHARTYTRTHFAILFIADKMYFYKIKLLNTNGKAIFVILN
jgi:hypothetical protein